MDFFDYLEYSAGRHEEYVTNKYSIKAHWQFCECENDMYSVVDKECERCLPSAKTWLNPFTIMITWYIIGMWSMVQELIPAACKRSIQMSGTVHFLLSEIPGNRKWFSDERNFRMSDWLWCNYVFEKKNFFFLQI